MTNKPKISVIVPIWGVEKYIEKCARSLFESTYKNIEFIFVDDCSPDHSIDVLKQVVEDYPDRRQNVIIVRHETNRGLPQARKTGFEASRGDWVTFCDSDDWVDKTMYQKMLEKAEYQNYDMVFCDFVYQTDNKVLWKPTYEAYDTHEKIRNGFLNCKISNAVWTKIIKRTIFEEKSIYFPKASMDEDDVFTSQWAYYARNIGYVNECLYFHYANPSSMTHEEEIEKIKKRLNERLENRIWIIDFLESRKDKYLDKIIYNNKRLAKLSILYAVLNKESYQQMLNLYSDINRKMVFGRDVSIKEKMINAIILLSYPTCKLLLTLKNKR